VKVLDCFLAPGDVFEPPALGPGPRGDRESSQMLPGSFCPCWDRRCRAGATLVRREHGRADREFSILTRV
jgi:hypothetical protein